MEKYKTSDLYLASFLKAKGKIILKAERTGQKVFFHFSGISDSDITGFYNNEKVGAITYKDALNNLKTMIFHGRE